jgi:hypothetical protein
MGRKLVPSGDHEFLAKAEAFACNISKDPARFALTVADAEAMTRAAKNFRDAFQATRFGMRSPVTTRLKNEARTEAKRLYIRCLNIIRRSESVDPIARQEAGIQDRPERLKSRACPMEPPRLEFARAHHENGATPVHELRFRGMESGVSKPEGAVRLELFVDLIPPDAPIPARPGANYSSRPWYLRSYTRSPIKLTPPIARVPMRVVYWARWADSVGNVGPFSKTAAAWIEGGSQAWLPGAVRAAPLSLGGQTPVQTLEDVRPIGPRSATRNTASRCWRCGMGR